MIDIYLGAPGYGKDVVDGLNSVEKNIFKLNVSYC